MIEEQQFKRCEGYFSLQKKKRPVKTAVVVMPQTGVHAALVIDQCEYLALIGRV